MIPSVVVDTDVLSFLFKEDTRGELYLPHLDSKLTIISFMTLAETDRWAEAIHSAKRNGLPIQTADGWVAATALLHNVPLVTHNKKHYIGVDGLAIISEV